MVKSKNIDKVTGLQQQVSEGVVVGKVWCPIVSPRKVGADMSMKGNVKGLLDPQRQQIAHLRQSHDDCPKQQANNAKPIEVDQKKDESGLKHKSSLLMVKSKNIDKVTGLQQQVSEGVVVGKVWCPIVSPRKVGADMSMKGNVKGLLDPQRQQIAHLRQSHDDCPKQQANNAKPIEVGETPD
ncbi:hypothetical protein SUGI_0181060 [Cryptomeria japonica]|nr:hypothetical protein SUGI_0181060 [Cryptomeria japonica]